MCWPNAPLSWDRGTNAAANCIPRTWLKPAWWPNGSRTSPIPFIGPANTAPARRVLAAAGRQLLEAAAELQKLAVAGQAARASAEAARKTLESAKDDYIASVRGEHQLRTLRRIQQREFITRHERKEVAELAETGAAMYFLNCRGAEETDA